MRVARKCRASKVELDEVGSLLSAAIAAASKIEGVAIELRGGAVGRCPPKGLLNSGNLLAKRIYRARRKGDEVAGTDGFSASPAFDTLLDLYINMEEGRLVSVSSACIGAACPPTTALRWIRHLEHQGLLARSIDTLDQGRT